MSNSIIEMDQLITIKFESSSVTMYKLQFYFSILTLHYGKVAHTC